MTVAVASDGARVPPGAEGRSVGLGVARRLAEWLDASLALDSRPGRTVRTVVLPGPAGGEPGGG